MTHYTGTASKLKVKKDAPAEVFALLDYVYRLDGTPRPGYDPEVVHVLPPLLAPDEKLHNVLLPLRNELSNTRIHMETWCWRVKEQHEDFVVYENRACLPSRELVRDAFEILLNAVRDYLVLEEGDIVYRWIGEDMHYEYVTCLKEGLWFEQKGYQYCEEYMEHESKTHPSRAAFPNREAEDKYYGVAERIESAIELPWTIAELEKIPTGKLKLF